MRRTALALAMVLFSVGFAFAGSQSLEMTPLDSRSVNNSFLYEEAGMSAYAQLDGTIDLTKAKNAMRTVEKSTAEYVLGSVELEGYSDSHDVHVYVDATGWIIAYYLLDEKPSKIINWVSYSEGNPISETKLSVALIDVSEAMSVLPSNIKYYDFRYPDATKMMIVADVEDGYRLTETFTIKIPSDISAYSRTWSLYVVGNHSGSILIDDVELHSANATSINEGDITISQLSPDEYHVVQIFNNENGVYGTRGTTYGAIMLLYKE